MTENTETLTVKDVCAKLKCSRQTLHAWVKANQFPKPKTIGTRSLRWLASDVDQWLSEHA